ncbi:MAG: oligosaccharide repeat unit polymerase [Cyclobacteriaceae bacterium]
MGFRIVNPYFLYIASFALALTVYQLGWSVYFPPLSASLLFFFCLTFLMAGIFAYNQYKAPGEYYRPIEVSGRKALMITAVLVVAWAIEFIFNGGIPLVDMLRGQRYDYRTFGMPTFHVVVVTFASFFATYLFHGFLSSRKRIFLWLCVLNLLPAILIMNRGMLLLNLSSCAFVYLLSLEGNQISFRWVFTCIAATVIVLFLFGVLGNFRLSNNLGRLYDRHLVFESGEAHESLRNSWLPSEFFWTYFYLSAPLGNLQHNVYNAHPEHSLSTFAIFINNELVPDAISKRVNAWAGLKPRQRLQVADHLNASTVFGGAYYYFGWAGMAMVFLVLILIAQFFCSWQMLRTGRYGVTCLAVLNTLFLFLIFDNLLVFSGFSFQFFYPFAAIMFQRLFKN